MKAQNIIFNIDCNSNRKLYIENDLKMKILEHKKKKKI